jgi:hypothetical protein
VLDPAQIKARKRVFMTATPRYFTGRVKKAAQEADWEVASMDEEAKFGPVLHRLSFASAIDRGLLSDYQVLVVGVTDANYHEMAERGAFVTADGRTVTDARTLARQIGLLRAMRNQDLHRVVSFHTRIESASRFATSLLAINDWMPSEIRASEVLWADHVSGRMTSGEREIRLNRLRTVGHGERGILTNARCLAEGVDVPTLDGIAFIDPRRSQVDVVQAVGRAMRKAPAKTLGTIVIPVLVDENIDPAEALALSEFDRVWQVVRALRDHDEVLAEELDQWRRELGRRGSLGQKPRKIVLDLPSAIGVEFARAFDARLVETTTSSWEFSFGLLERFVAREGHTRVLISHLEDGYPLGKWVRQQRKTGVAGRLSSSRTARLAALPGWIWEPHDADWEKGYDSLVRFVDRQGHSVVVGTHVEDGHPLGSWVRHQRRLHLEGRLSAERAQRLEALPGWTWSPWDSSWEKGFAYLQRFFEDEGDTDVPKSHVVDGYPLGQWAHTQRSFKKAGRLSPERAGRLEALPGWKWDPREVAWEKAWLILERFVAREHHSRVPSKHTEDGFRLGEWVVRQRYSHGRRELSAAQAERLALLPGWTWNTVDADWEDAFVLLSHFVTREGHARVPSGGVEDGFPLGRWVGAQRRIHRAGRLSDERIAALEALTGWSWSPRRESAWEDGFLLLERFAVRERHSRVPGRHVEGGYPLGVWVSTQRAFYSSGRLSPERAARLEDVPGWSWGRTPVRRDRRESRAASSRGSADLNG